VYEINEAEEYEGTGFLIKQATANKYSYVVNIVFFVSDVG
jgi:hypothetical protein